MNSGISQGDRRSSFDRTTMRQRGQRSHVFLVYPTRILIFFLLATAGDSSSTLAFTTPETSSPIQHQQQRRRESPLHRNSSPLNPLVRQSRSSSSLLLGTLFRFRTSCLFLARGFGNPSDNPKDKNNKRKKKKLYVQEAQEEEDLRLEYELNTTLLEGRVQTLEELVARQEVEIARLKQDVQTLVEAAQAFGNVVELLRAAGLETPPSSKNPLLSSSSLVEQEQPTAGPTNTTDDASSTLSYIPDVDIFGTAPESVIDAADSAGAAILAGMLGGQQRMLVDVRDAELSRDPETLVQFLELAILPVAAGLEGLSSVRNRVKIVFPTVMQLSQYRKSMALAAPEVVALSTLGFDPVEKQDNIVVIVAPSPDDEEGLAAMNELLAPTDPNKKPITQPLVVLNHHMVPVSGPASEFEVAYHLRLLSVQFMTGENAPEYFSKWEDELREEPTKRKRQQEEDDDEGGEETIQNRTEEILYGPKGDVASPEEESTDEDAALEAAMQHARELAVNQGVTRAMVIRAFPKPWHVFVDTSPDTDADFEVAATFDEEPSQDDVNFAIVECLEGSEHEDELVAQQMQQALEAGQLDRVSEMLGTTAGQADDDQEEDTDDDEDSEDDDDLFSDFDQFKDEDSC